IVYDQKEIRSFFRLTAITLLFTIGGIVFALCAMGALIVLPAVFRHLGLAGAWETLVTLARWPVLFVSIVLILALIYRFGPDRSDARWRWITWGSAFASLAWLVFSLLFSWYAANFGNYNKTYGSLGAVIGFMTWMWLSAIVVLIGAEIDAEMEAEEKS